jgi:hypothetical protein
VELKLSPGFDYLNDMEEYQNFLKKLRAKEGN